MRRWLVDRRVVCRGGDCACVGVFLVVSIGVSVVVIRQLLHVDRARVVGSVHSVHVEAFAALESFVSSRWLLRPCVLHRIFHVVHDRNVDGWLRHRLLLVLQFSRQCLRVAVVFIWLVQCRGRISIFGRRWCSIRSQTICALAVTSKCRGMGTKTREKFQIRISIYRIASSFAENSSSTRKWQLIVDVYREQLHESELNIPRILYDDRLIEYMSAQKAYYLCKFDTVGDFWNSRWAFVFGEEFDK